MLHRACSVRVGHRGMGSRVEAIPVLRPWDTHSLNLPSQLEKRRRTTVGEARHLATISRVDTVRMPLPAASPRLRRTEEERRHRTRPLHTM